MKRTISLLVSLVTLCAPALAQPESVALPFLRISQDPSAAAVGGAYLGSTEATAYSAFGNPAAIPFSGKTADFALSYQSWNASSTNYINFGGVYNLKDKVGFTLGFSYGAGQPYEVISGFNKKPTTFKPNDMTIGLGCGFKLCKFLTAGLNLKYASNKLAEETSYGTVACDIYVMGKVSDFTATLGVTSLGGKVGDKKANTRYPIPASADLGLGYNKTFADAHTVRVLFDASYYFCKKFGCGAGASYTWNDMVSVRGGYHYGGVVGDHGSVGLGAQFFGVHLDAVYYIAAKESPMANTFAIGLGYRF